MALRTIWHGLGHFTWSTNDPEPDFRTGVYYNIERDTVIYGWQPIATGQAEFSVTGFRDDARGNQTITFTQTSYPTAADNQTSRNLHVIDNTPPVITVDHPIKEVYVGGSGKQPNSLPDLAATFGITVTDNIAGKSVGGVFASDYPITPTYSGQTTRPTTPGDYTLTITATDFSGNVNQVEVIWRAVDAYPPVFSSVAQVTLNQFDDYVSPSATDAIDGAIIPVQTGGALPATDPSNPARLLPGAYTATWTATDSAGNVATLVQTVTVRAPTITDVHNGTLQINASEYFDENDITGLSAPGFGLEASIITDNQLPVRSLVLFEGSVARDAQGRPKPGTYALTYRATDTAGNYVDHVRTVTVVDDIPPVISFSPGASAGDPLLLEAEPRTYDEIRTAVRSAVSATDNDGNPLRATMESHNVNTLVPGNYTATLSASDSAGNTTTATRHVKIQDTTAPKFTSVPNRTLEANSTPFEHADLTIGVTAYDVTGNVTITVDNDASLSLQDGNHGRAGSYQITLRATDGAGNWVTTQRTIVVQDTTNPVIKFPTDEVVLEAGNHSEEFIVSKVLEGVSASDSSGTTVTLSVSHTVDPLVPNIAGQTYQATIRAEDENGKSSTVNRNVRVKDETPPNFNVTSLEPLTIEAQSTAFTEAQLLQDLNASAVATDATGFVTLSVNPVLTAAQSSTPDDYVVKVVATDAYNNSTSESESLNRTITVVDRTPPEFNVTSLEPLTIEAQSTAFTETQLLQGLDASTIASDVTGSVTLSVNSVLSATQSSTTGDYVVKVVATDGYGNSAEKERYVYVRDRTPPVITFPTDEVVLEAGNHSEEFIVSEVLEGVSASDSSGTTVTLSVSHTVDPRVPNIAGQTYQAIIRAEDGNGKWSTASRNVRVKDETPPYFNVTSLAPLTIEAQSTAFTEAQLLQDLNASAIAADVTGTVTLSVNPVLTAAQSSTTGSYVVKVVATDAYNNSTSESDSLNRTITVVDTTPPYFNVTSLEPLTIEAQSTAFTEAQLLQDLNASAIAADVTGTVTLSVNPVLSATQSSTPDDYVVKVVATDGSGNSTSESDSLERTITVVDRTPPVITGPSSVTLRQRDSYDPDAGQGLVISDNAIGEIVTSRASGAPPIPDVDRDGRLVPGTYLVAFQAVDASNNTSDPFEQTVVVADGPAVTDTSGGPLEIESTDVGYDFEDVSWLMVEGEGSSAALFGTVPIPRDERLQGGTYVLTYIATDADDNATFVQRTVHVVTAPTTSVPEPDSSATPVDSTNVGVRAGGDTHYITGNDDFKDNSAIVGLTSSIDEFVHIGREQFMQIFEEALGDVVVFQVECDINGLLDMAGVHAPHNESLNALTDEQGNPIHDETDQIQLDKVGMFEYLLKHAGADLGTAEQPRVQKSWDELGPSNGKNGNKLLYQQVRSFLGDFFDHDKELNAIVAQTNSSDPRALVLLDDDRIVAELKNLKNDSEQKMTQSPAVAAYTTYDGDTALKEPRNRKCLATNLLSVRQVAQVLEAFAAMGVGSADSRVQRANAGTAENPDYYYRYQLHKGDSITGECKIFDADAVSAGRQYSQVVKIQLTQSEAGASDRAETPIDPDDPGFITDPTDINDPNFVDSTEPATNAGEDTAGSMNHTGHNN